MRMDDDDKISVLDHGFVRLVDYMGSDSAIVQAARVSYGAGTKSVREDQGLINYLLKNGHTSPFEQVVFKFHIKCPIFVARQWVRHRTARMNEISGRYSEMRDEFYVPELWRVQDKKNKQGSVEAVLDHNGMSSLVEEQCRSAFAAYQELLSKGAAREMARIVLPLNLYTEFYWQMDLHNLLHFLRLRLDAHAQHEIRVYGEAIAEMVKTLVPMAWEAFREHVLCAKKFSATEFQELIEMREEARAVELADEAVPLSIEDDRQLPLPGI